MCGRPPAFSQPLTGLCTGREASGRGRGQTVRGPAVPADGSCPLRAGHRSVVGETFCRCAGVAAWAICDTPRAEASLMRNQFTGRTGSCQEDDPGRYPRATAFRSPCGCRGRTVSSTSGGRLRPACHSVTTSPWCWPALTTWPTPSTSTGAAIRRNCLCRRSQGPDGEKPPVCLAAVGGGSGASYQGRGFDDPRRRSRMPRVPRCGVRRSPHALDGVSERAVRRAGRRS